MEFKEIRQAEQPHPRIVESTRTPQQEEQTSSCCFSERPIHYHLAAIKRPSTSVSRQTPSAKGLIKKNKHADGLPQYIPAKGSLSTLKIKHRKVTEAASSS
ncbi:hypothetical protein TcCL_Unassigned02741 [Trypanosoma cruzi]|nr:hypothetical protein TcCL_Unassigned02741 [Trypanosoma cruzi]